MRHPSGVRHPLRGGAPLKGCAAPQGVRAAACGKPLQSSSGSRGSAGRGFCGSPFFVVIVVFRRFWRHGKVKFCSVVFFGSSARKNLIATHIGEIGVLTAERQDEARTHRRDLRGVRGALLR